MPTDVNISDYSGDVSAGDWSPAILAAWDDLTNGGTIRIDQDITIKSRMDMDGYLNLNVVGDGGSRVSVDFSDTSSNAPGFNIANMGMVVFRDLVFVGDTGTGAAADVYSLIQCGFLELLTVESCKFAGILAARDIVQAGDGTNLICRDLKFGGCGGTHIHAENTNSFTLENIQMLDYAVIGGNYYDRQQARVWIKADSADANLASTGRMESIFLDEGGGAVIEDYRFITINNFGHNVGGGLALTNILDAKLTNTWFGYQTVSEPPGVTISDCSIVTVDHMDVSNNIHRIVVDANTKLIVTNSPEVIVDADAGADFSFNGIRQVNGLTQIG